MCELESIVGIEADWSNAPATCSGRSLVIGKEAQAASSEVVGTESASVAESSAKASVEAIARINLRKSNPCDAKSSARIWRGAGISPALAMSSIGSTRGRPKRRAQARLAVALEKFGL